MKPYEANQTVAKLIQDGTRTLLMAIDEDRVRYFDEFFSEYQIEDLLHEDLPLKVGEQYFLQEEFYVGQYGRVFYRADFEEKYIKKDNKFIPSKYMTLEKSRFKFEVSVEVKRVFDLKKWDYFYLGVPLEKDDNHHKIIEDWMDEQHGVGFCKSNPFVALIEVKEIV